MNNEITRALVLTTLISNCGLLNVQFIRFLRSLKYFTSTSASAITGLVDAMNEAADALTKHQSQAIRVRPKTSRTTCAAGLCDCATGLGDCATGPGDCATGLGDCATGIGDCASCLSGTRECISVIGDCATGLCDCAIGISGITECASCLSDYATGIRVISAWPPCKVHRPARDYENVHTSKVLIKEVNLALQVT